MFFDWTSMSTAVRYSVVLCLFFLQGSGHLQPFLWRQTRWTGYLKPYLCADKRGCFLMFLKKLGHYQSCFLGLQETRYSTRSPDATRQQKAETFDEKSGQFQPTGCFWWEVRTSAAFFVATTGYFWREVETSPVMLIMTKCLHFLWEVWTSQPGVFE